MRQKNNCDCGRELTRYELEECDKCYYTIHPDESTENYGPCVNVGTSDDSSEDYDHNRDLKDLAMIVGGNKRGSQSD